MEHMFAFVGYTYQLLVIKIESTYVALLVFHTYFLDVIPVYDHIANSLGVDATPYFSDFCSARAVIQFHMCATQFSVFRWCRYRVPYFDALLCLYYFLGVESIVVNYGLVQN
jgi:hypothetical protein